MLDTNSEVDGAGEEPVTPPVISMLVNLVRDDGTLVVLRPSGTGHSRRFSGSGVTVVIHAEVTADAIERLNKAAAEKIRLLEDRLARYEGLPEAQTRGLSKEIAEPA